MRSAGHSAGGCCDLPPRAATTVTAHTSLRVVRARVALVGFCFVWVCVCSSAALAAPEGLSNAHAQPGTSRAGPVPWAAADAPMIELSTLGGTADRVSGRRSAPALVLTTGNSSELMQDLNGTLWMTPDQASVSVAPAASQDSGWTFTANAVGSFSAYSSYSGWYFDLGVVGVGSLTVQGHINSLLQLGGRVVAVTRRLMPAYSGRTWPYQAVASSQAEAGTRFSAALAALPDACEDEADQYAYRLLLADWGTDMITFVRSGLQVVFFVSFDESLLEAESADWIMQQMSAWVSLACIRLGIQEGTGFNESSLNSTFTGQATMDTLFMGGELSLFFLNETAYAASTAHSVALETEWEPLDRALPRGSPQQACLSAAIDEWVLTNGSLLGPAALPGPGRKSLRQGDHAGATRSTRATRARGQQAPPIASPGATGRRAAGRGRPTHPAQEPPTCLDPSSGALPPLVMGSFGTPLGQGFDMVLQEGRPEAQIFSVNTSCCAYTVPDPYNTFNQSTAAPRVCVPGGLYYGDRDMVVDDTAVLAEFEFATLAQTYGEYLGVQASYAPAPGVNVSASFGRLREWYDQASSFSAKGLGLSVRTVQLYGLDVYLTGGVAPELEALFGQLPAGDPVGCLGDPACRYQYCQVILKFGTHCVTGVTMGAASNATVSFSTAFNESHSWSVTEEQISVALTLVRQAQGIAGFAWSQNVTSAMLDASFEATMLSETYGGDADLMDGPTPDYSAWLSSVLTAPKPVAHLLRLRPLHELLVAADPESLIRRELLRQAGLQYVESGGSSCT